ncbi:MAG: protein translocase subunit SecD [Phycisphaerae bacterium]|nr:protein translocase subunit SecD [Phycisphaerae bacterium]
MKNISLRLGIIVTLCALAMLALYLKPIRLGKDLRGGVSLVYAVKAPGGGRNSEQAIGQVIDVLKQRVNPKGLLDIAMQPQGSDRIEVVMPLPSEAVRKLQVEYRAALEAFMKNAIVNPTELDQALAAGKAPETFGTSGVRGDDLRTLQAAYTARVNATAELEQAKVSGADPAAVSEIENRLVANEITERRLRSKILGATLNEARIVNALGLSQQPQPSLDPLTGRQTLDDQNKPVLLPSPRSREIESIKAEFPHLLPLVDDLAEKHDAYMSQRTGFDDPEDLIRLLSGAGVLEFHIAVQASSPEVDVAALREQLGKRGPQNTDSATARWFQLNDLKQWYQTPQQLEALQRDPVGYFATARDLVAAQYAGSTYLLLYTADSKSMTHSSGDRWSLTQVYRTIDQRLGGSAVAFQLDSTGAGRMGRLTGPHVNQPMAIVLDNQVYTAPDLNSAISGSGVITGQFTDADVSYLIRVLTAGSLEASISPQPIAMYVIGPSIGAENLSLGQKAMILSIIFTGLLMIAYYFLAGFIADIGLAVHALLIFGIMATIDGSFTLPGLAGVALSVAMAVDANVLIYERMREEMMLRGESLRNAIRVGFHRALPPIVDGNITNLIVVLVLYQFGAAEVKGFALTMLIGIATALFASLFVTRTLFMVAVDWAGMHRLHMLPTVFPAVSRLLTPRVNWVSLRTALWLVSAIVAVSSVALVVSRGRDIFETEFRGGVAMTLTTRMATADEPRSVEGRLLLKRAEVEERVRAVGASAAEDPILHEIRNANVVTVGESGAESDSDSFQIRVGNPAVALDDESKITDTVVEAVVREFADEIDIQFPLKFKDAGGDYATHTYRIEGDLLGDSIGRPEIREPLADYNGGVAVVVDEIDPPVSTANVLERITRMRSQPDFSDTAGRRTKVVGLTPADPLDPSKGFTSVAILVSDHLLTSINTDFEVWDKQLAQLEWKLATASLQQKASLKAVSSFSPIVAENLAATAVVAVILSLIGMLFYIWVRFGSLRFSTAAIMSLVFNVICCLGFLAAAPWLAHTAIGRALYIEEFRIDLNVVAALLAIIGYAINDTIVILDRVRENRGKLPFVTRACVNDSINQTFSRTVLTGGSTLATAVILIVLGGTGIRPFAYTFFIGLVAGTISSIIIAAPMVYSRREEEEERRKADLDVRGVSSPSTAIAPA